MTNEAAKFLMVAFFMSIPPLVAITSAVLNSKRQDKIWRAIRSRDGLVFSNLTDYEKQLIWNCTNLSVIHIRNRSIARGIPRPPLDWDSVSWMARAGPIVIVEHKWLTRRRFPIYLSIIIKMHDYKIVDNNRIPHIAREEALKHILEIISSRKYPSCLLTRKTSVRDIEP